MRQKDADARTPSIGVGEPPGVVAQAQAIAMSVDGMLGLADRVTRHGRSGGASPPGRGGDAWGEAQRATMEACRTDARGNAVPPHPTR